jgi:flagellar basal body rod protein FlgC
VWNETMLRTYDANIEIYEVRKRLVKKAINPDK